MDKNFRSNNIEDGEGELKEQDNYNMVEVHDGQHMSLIYYLRELEQQTTTQQQIPQQELRPQPIIEQIQIQHRVKLDEISGLLHKKSPHWYQGYSDRYCTLQNRVFRYYSADHKVLQGVLNFDVQTYEYQETKDKCGNILEFSLKPVGNCDKVFAFKGQNNKDTQMWATLITIHLLESNGHSKMLKTLCTIQRYWRNERMSPDQFLDDAQDMDLILFRGKDINCQMQRALTQSQYDHVALVIRMNCDEIYFFEALPMHGVGLCRWSTFVTKRWFKLYEKICIRKLHLERTPVIKGRYHDFVNENIGKKYSLTPGKLLRYKSVILEKSQQMQNRTYFCSELVAKCYKHLCVLPKELSSTQYWPGSFSQENNKLKLIIGELSEEYLLDFTNH